MITHHQWLQVGYKTRMSKAAEGLIRTGRLVNYLNSNEVVDERGVAREAKKCLKDLHRVKQRLDDVRLILWKMLKEKDVTEVVESEPVVPVKDVEVPDDDVKHASRTGCLEVVIGILFILFGVILGLIFDN